ncbi:lyase family protein [Embleya scabrispora]|uniref:lyase family protein n=1 Tax=Embleya scabrispora TaxID=159449 RepID=UPI0003706093|nr:lyase family protein [Embleya scabrispora]MYS84613.1 aspartate ammonia-lyase [Streptomyces sp. SID5474]
MRDSLGEVVVPEGVLYGPHTARALRNFAVPGPRLCDHPEFVHALVTVKIAAARANAALGTLDPAIADAITEAGAEVLAGRHLRHFVLPVVQGGGGTSTNMNVNEVLARRATEILRGRGNGHESLEIHPNDHVNRGQSTNDVMPTAIGIAVYRAAGRAVDGLRHLCDVLNAKADEYTGLVHLGRTCLQDAVPIPVSAVHRAQAHAIAEASTDLADVAERLLAVPLGGTAVGTGIGAADGFGAHAVRILAEATDLPVRPAKDPHHALASLEPLAHVTEAMSRSGRTIARVATDLRLLASGPHGGIAEVLLPGVQSGSSIMPGKVNPVIPELVMQTAFQLAGAATTAHLAVSAGELEVSPMAPVVTLGLLTGLPALAETARIFADRCVAGLCWDREAVARHLRGSLAPAVNSATTEGYEAAARAAYARPAANLDHIAKGA